MDCLFYALWLIPRAVNCIIILQLGISKTDTLRRALHCAATNRRISDKSKIDFIETVEKIKSEGNVKLTEEFLKAVTELK
jgi:hypothetical protein